MKDLKNKQINEVPTRLRSMCKIMERKKICRNGVLGVFGGSLRIINLNIKERYRMKIGNWKLTVGELGPLETSEIKDLKVLGVEIHEMKKYRFRAEIPEDFINFLMNSTRAIRCYRYKVVKHDHTIPDIEVWLETTKPLEFIRDELRKVVDGHVMVQSLALEQDYTGERDYSL